MDILSLELAKLLDCVADVNRKLSEREAADRLLKEAQEAVPAIEELMGELALLYTREDSQARQEGLTAAKRDLSILLALWTLEGKPHRDDPSTGPAVKDAPSF